MRSSQLTVDLHDNVESSLDTAKENAQASATTGTQEKTQEVNYWYEKIKNMYNKAESELNSARKDAQNSLETLRQLQIDIIKNELVKFSDLIVDINTTITQFNDDPLAIELEKLRLFGFDDMMKASILAVLIANTEKKQKEAHAYYKSIKPLCEAMKDWALTHKEILAKNEKQIKNIKEIKDLFAEIEDTMQKKGTEVSAWNRMEQAALKTLIQLTKAIAITINDSIPNNEDPLIQQLINHYKKCQELIQEIEREWGDQSKVNIQDFLDKKLKLPFPIFVL